MIDPNDDHLTTRERAQLRRIALRLDGESNTPRLPPHRPRHNTLPNEYRAELDRVFGTCGLDGDLSERGKPGGE